MELLNATKMIAGYTMGMKPDGRELLVVVVKGTFDFPEYADQIPALSQQQLPLVMADEFTGEPGFSAPLVEAEFVPNKPKPEVLLNGTCYAPRGEATTSVEVGLRVGSVNKTFRVVGDRVWKSSMMGPVPSDPLPFTSMPISYDVAFGGRDETEEPHSAYAMNPVGRGYHARPHRPSIDERPLPNTEQIERPIRDPREAYLPMAFGPWGRSWPPRMHFAGTYDERWQQEQFPFLPNDFDERYYQSAPMDQQLEHLVGGEVVELKNLTPDGICRFQIPTLRVPIEFVGRDFDSQEQDARLDTLMIDADKRQFSMLWRACWPLKRNMFEINMAIVGRMPRGWYRARSSAKTYYPDLHQLIVAKSE